MDNVQYPRNPNRATGDASSTEAEGSPFLCFDFEGDPLLVREALSISWGTSLSMTKGEARYTGLWALSREEEKCNFEQFVDWVMERWRQHPGRYIYHFAPYEPAALKRLMGRYASREEEIDRMLRAKLFVDLYAVIRHALRAGIESYSIKQLEQFYGFRRTIDLPDANHALASVETCLELAEPEGISADQKTVVETYNCDDCASTHALSGFFGRP
jgi:predicted RecB family nuclease